MNKADAELLAGIASLNHHKTSDTAFLLRIINEQDAQLARAEKVIAAARAVIAQYEPHEIVDGEAELQRALAEYDRPSAPLDEKENG